MPFRSVKELKTNTRRRIRITTESGSVYEFGEADGKLCREISKAGMALGEGFLTGIAEYPEHIDPKRTGGVFMGTSPLSDGRVLAHVESIKIGDSLGARIEPFGGIGSSPIIKIEVERG